MRFKSFKKLKKQILSLLLVSSLVLTGCSGGSTTGEGEDELEKEQYEIMVMNQYGEVVSGADVLINGSSYTTSDYGTVKFTKPAEGNYAVTVTCKDYYDYTVSDYCIGSGSTGRITIKAKSLSAHRLASAIYKRGLGSTNLVDTYKKINQGTSGWSFSIEATVCGEADTIANYKLFQKTDSGEKVIAESSTGKFDNLNVNSFSAGTGVFVTVYDKSGHETSTSLRLEIAEDPNLTKYTELSFGSENKIKVSDKVPIFGGTELSFGFPSLPLDYKVSEDKIHIGFNVDDTTFDDDALFDEYKKMLNQIKAAKFQATNMKTAIAQLKKKQKKKGAMGMLGFDKGVEVTCSGYAEAGFNSDGTLSSGTGYLCIAAEASAEFDWQYVVWVVPVTIGIEGKIEAKLADTITYDFKENKLEGDASLTIAPSLKANAGVGFKYLNAGVYGSAGLETKLIIASLTEEPGFSYLDLNSSIGIYAKAGIFEPECDLAQGTFHLWTRDNSVSKQSVNVTDGMVDCSDFYDLTNYGPSTKADRITINAVSQGDKTVLSSGIGSGASPVTLSNGTNAINVYSVRESVDGTDYTSEKLYYQTYTVSEDGNGTWSDAKRMDEGKSQDGILCSEMNQKLCTDGTDYYMVYQDLSVDTETVAEYASGESVDEKNTILTKMWKSVDLHVKKYDVSEDKWIDYGRIGTDGVFDYNGDIVVHNDMIYVYSAANAQGDYFGTNTADNYINLSSHGVNDTDTSAQWTVTSKVSGLNSVTSLEAGIRNGKVDCVYVVDADNDFSTDEQNVYSYNNGAEVSKVCTGSAVTVDCPSVPGNMFIMASNDKLFYINSDGSVVDMLAGMGSYDGVYAITERAVYFEKNTEDSTEIYACYKLPDGSYGEAVQVTGENRWLRNLSAFTLGGRDILVTLSEEYNEEDSRITASEIDVFEVSDYYDLNVEDAYYDVDEAVTASELPVTVTLKNEGCKKISYVKMDVKDADNNEITLSDQYYTVDMNPGEEKDVILNMSGLDKTECGEWKISVDVVDSMLAVESTPEVETVSGEAVSEENVSFAEPEIISENTTENNTLTMNMGNSDLVINMEMCDSGAYPYMIVEVTNEGNRTDSATLKLYDANDTKKEYGSRNISSLAPGKTKLFKININADWADANGKVAVLAFVEDSSNEIYTYNNYSYQYISLNYGTFHIAYELNGGQNNAENPATYTTADTISLKDPSMPGYTFGGWYTSSTFDVITKVTEISSGNAQDIVLYAKWTKTGQDKEKDAENKDNSGKEDKNNGTGNSSKDVKLLKKGIVKELSKYNAVVKITKSGKMANGKITGGEVQYVKPMKQVASSTIPDTVIIQKSSYKVRSVASNAFKKNKVIKKVSIGKNVTVIGKNAFLNCKKLRNITIKGTGLRSVGKNAIKGISSKTEIRVPKTKYKDYKKLFSKKTGFRKKIKIRKSA